MKGRRAGMRVEALGLLVCGTSMFLGHAGAAADEITKPGVMAGAEVILPNHHDVSAPLRDIKPITPDWWELTGEKNEHPVLPLPHHHGNADLGLVTDAARQDPTRAPQLNVSATAGLSFDGLGLPSYTPSGAPPDTNGAAG